jgi:hypothetical protein
MDAFGLQTFFKQRMHIMPHQLFKCIPNFTKIT